MNGLITPYGGKLVNLVAEGKEKDQLAQQARGILSIRLSWRSVFDLELIATGAFSPLDSFMGSVDQELGGDNCKIIGGPVRGHSVCKSLAWEGDRDVLHSISFR